MISFSLHLLLPLCVAQIIKNTQIVKKKTVGVLETKIERERERRRLKLKKIISKVGINYSRLKN